jgi:hypothetical protein
MSLQALLPTTAPSWVAWVEYNVKQIWTEITNLRLFVIIFVLG